MGQGGHQVIGIDLGTTFCAMSYLDRLGAPVTISNSEGELTTPSVILFDPDGTVSVGRHALRTCRIYPDRVAVCIKREIGEAFCDEPIAGRRISPVYISSLILKKLKQDAEKKIGPVAGAVITVPAYFDETRRRATVEAGTIAGLNVLDVMNEPTAAALAYGFRHYIEQGGDTDDLDKAVKSSSEPDVILVYDLGGGTFDVTVIRIEAEEFRVLATDGDVRLGGKDWDDRIVEHAAKLFKDEYGNDPREDPLSLQELVLAVEDAKKDLSLRNSTVFTVHHKGNRLVVTLEREQFEEMTGELLFRTENRLCRVIESAGVTWKDIDRILLVGGSTRMPQVAQMLRCVSGKEPDGSLSVDEVVAHGAAIQAAIIAVTGKTAAMSLAPAEEPDKIGEEKEEVVILPSSDEMEQTVADHSGSDEPDQSMPCKPLDDDSQDFISVAFDFSQEVTEALADVRTVNVNSHSLGIVVHSAQTGQKRTAFLIPRNSPLPASRKKVFGTMVDNQELVKVRVLEGESRDPEICITIGECIVAPLARGLPRGSPVTVTFSYDNSGQLHVKAVDEASGTKAQTLIVRQTAMSEMELVQAQEVVDRISVS